MNENDLLFKPCKNCGSNEYDLSEQKADYDTDLKTSKTIIHPDTCDVCDFKLLLSESNLLH